METDVEKYSPLIAEMFFRLSSRLNIVKFSRNGVLKNTRYRVKGGCGQICPSIYNDLFELFYEQITLLDLNGPKIPNSLNEIDLVLIFFSDDKNYMVVEFTLPDDMVYEFHFSSSGKCTHKFFYHVDEEDEDEEYY
ncbi:hypothetical protein A5882_003480 [Enterococcus sp. 4E1_DIV0656]|uniref:hypothetical protein n=1 Tax=Enterococcus sp. 4E1_DIV0656 TaxID=1834180 RepID=UPI000A36A006|nr:hypothetical protein [Enterococcus sp. 4E1_DIV0656]OTO09150.1 hypothetical protein A5882_003480 [Enterococcus sp. 4E1_DIV0656]